MKLNEEQKRKVATITSQLCGRGIWRSRPPQDREDAEQEVIATVLTRIENENLEVDNLEAYVRRSVPLEICSCMQKIDRDRKRLRSNSLWPSGNELDSVTPLWEPDWSDNERETLRSAIALLPEPLRLSVDRFLNGHGRGKGRDHYKFCRALRALRSIVARHDFW